MAAKSRLNSKIIRLLEAILEEVQDVKARLDAVEGTQAKPATSKKPAAKKAQ